MLDNALDYGIKEKDFWEMTFAEIHRAVNSAIRVRKVRTQEKATYDYLLAQLIAKGVSKALGDKGDYPAIEDVYPGVFDDLVEEKKAKIEEQKIKLSALRFRQFTQSFNSKFKEGNLINE